MANRAVHVTIEGRVQGVGYRAWVEGEAEARGLVGWVRNRRTGTVEAVFSGEAESVEAMVKACHTGPHGAKVTKVASAPYHGPDLTRFTQLRTE